MRLYGKTHLIFTAVLSVLGFAVLGFILGFVRIPEANPQDIQSGNDYTESLPGKLPDHDSDYYLTISDTSENEKENIDYKFQTGKLKDSPLAVSIIVYFGFLIMFLPINSESYDNSWWDDDWSFNQEIFIPIDTNSEMAKYQPIDIRIEYDIQ